LLVVTKLHFWRHLTLNPKQMASATFAAPILQFSNSLSISFQNFTSCLGLCSASDFGFNQTLSFSSFWVFINDFPDVPSSAFSNDDWFMTTLAPQVTSGFGLMKPSWTGPLYNNSQRHPKSLVPGVGSFLFLTVTNHFQLDFFGAPQRYNSKVGTCFPYFVYDVLLHRFQRCGFEGLPQGPHPRQARGVKRSPKLMWDPKP